MFRKDILLPSSDRNWTCDIITFCWTDHCRQLSKKHPTWTLTSLAICMQMYTEMRAQNFMIAFCLSVHSTSHVIRNSNKTITALSAPNPFPLPEERNHRAKGKHCIRSGYYQHTGKWWFCLCIQLLPPGIISFLLQLTKSVSTALRRETFGPAWLQQTLLSWRPEGSTPAFVLPPATSPFNVQWLL